MRTISHSSQLAIQGMSPVVRSWWWHSLLRWRIHTKDKKIMTTAYTEHKCG